ncbi:phosphate acyltransferase PlsX [Iamia majanohamensis]|uniref:Phosphate acyltransferase n=1 Tax=Iamia majanohamensis TaxID=467976 RepID=A0AAF0BT13_9ACTN|nr:phosphate acyltransferase PlsX [Iamia majanohamensis]WCO69231.1 phosphate acyltransferase PlsX [Iamia majanohamensis]
MTLPAPIAVDAMGGDRAPDEIVAGAERAAAELDLPVVLVGDPDRVRSSLEVLPASEVIAMDEDPGRGVRRKKDSSLVRAAEAVRDGRASAMVSAGNTGATWGAALLRMGRIKGVSRPAIATPLPRPGHDTPLVLLDAGANVDCQAEWLVQFAQMGAVFARDRYGLDAPRVGLLSIGEEPGKGDGLRKEAHALLDDPSWAERCGATFAGNVEGRDLMAPGLDVVVTDGFTGNVALKTLEGAMRSLVGAVLGAFDTDDATRAAGDVLMPALLPLYGQLDPDATGGAMLLGVDGVCIISHGSSSATAVVNACRVAAESVSSGLVDAVRGAVGTPA